MHVGRRLTFDGTFEVVDHKVHLGSGAQTPEAELGETLPIGVIAAQFVKHPVLESLSEKLGAGFKRTAPGEEIDDSDVVKIELVRQREPPFGTLPVRREHPGNQSVTEDLKGMLEALDIPYL